MDHHNGEIEGSSMQGAPLQKTVWTIQERLDFLETEYMKLLSSNGANRNVGHLEIPKDKVKEERPELDYASYSPACEVARISSDHWRDVKKEKFAVPERNVITIVSRSRTWVTGQRLKFDKSRDLENGVVEDIPATPATPVTEVSSERPHRVAITGHDLHRALEKIFSSPISIVNNVWVWPFKHFVTYEAEIKQCLEEQTRLVGTKASDIDVDGCNTEENGQITAQNNKSEVNGAVNATAKDPRPKTSINIELGTKLRDQLRCLVHFMDNDMKEIFAVRQKIADGTLREIAFDHLWQLFSPGDAILSNAQVDSQRRAFRVLHVTGGRTILDLDEPPQPDIHASSRNIRSWERHGNQSIANSYSKYTPFIIDCFYLDFDGQSFGPVSRRFIIQEYEGERSIESLPAFPTKFDKNWRETEKQLIKRGKRFVKLAGVTHNRYIGLSAKEPSITESQDEVNSEVVIDFALAIKHFRKTVPDWDVELGAGVIEKATRADLREVNEVRPCPIKDCKYCKNTDIFDDWKLDLDKRSEFLNSTRLLRYRRYENADLSSEQLLLFPPRVYGYALLDRKWYPLNIDLVQDIKPNTDSGFDDLVLPGAHKRIMQALVKNHTRGSRPTSGKDEDAEFAADLVRGKGKGLIILLHGVPGVGKTSTAECVAAQTKRPLFPITCGDIGTTATEVEASLEDYFDLAHKWGCVLLLDEADVYLASRERGGDLQRNSLVSVFLRVLEYYSGILILTTNRVGEFDEAFKSRIHMSLYYPKLDRESTIKIWEMNLMRIRRDDINIDVQDDKIMKFAKAQWSESKLKLTRRWNGRQIKNAFQIAIALAKWDFNDDKNSGKTDLKRPKLSEKQFKVVSQTSAHFDDYISNVHGIEEDDTYATLAERETLRKDSVMNATALRGRDSFGAPSTSKSSKRIASKYDASDDEDEVDGVDGSDEDDDQKIRELELKLELEKMKGRKKSVTKERMISPKTRDQPSRRSKQRVDDSSDHSDRSMSQ